MAEVSVRTRVRTAMRLQVVLLLLVGLSGLLGTYLTSRAVGDLLDRVGPLVSVNAAVLQDLTDAETGVRGWVLSGQRRALEPYEAGTARLAGHQATLRELAEGNEVLETLVRRQELAASAWLSDYAQLRVNGPEAPTYSARLFGIGKDRFDALRGVNAEVAAAITAEADAARAHARRILHGVLVVILALTVIAVLTATALGRQMVRHVVRPLLALEATVRRLTGGDGAARAHPSGVVEVRHLATAVNELAEENTRAREVEGEVMARLRELDRVRSDFVSNVSHELRTPLTSIQGYVEVLSDELEDRLDPAEVAALRTVDRNVVRLRDLIEDLLHLSHAESRGTTLRVVDLREVLAEVVSDVRVSASKNSVTMRLTGGTSRPALVLADRSQVLRAVLNVVSNAVKFSRNAGEVEVCLAGTPHEVEVIVRDQGIGIPAAELDRLGSRFYRASNAVSAEIGGTGLGLRIVRTIMDNHGGRVQVDSVEGAGTTVRLVLPRRAEDDGV